MAQDGEAQRAARRKPAGALVTLLEAEVDGWVENLKAASWWAEIRDLSPREQERKIRATAALQSLTVFETILDDARVDRTRGSLSRGDA